MKTKYLSIFITFALAIILLFLILPDNSPQENTPEIFMEPIEVSESSPSKVLEEELTLDRLLIDLQKAAEITGDASGGPEIVKIRSNVDSDESFERLLGYSVQREYDLEKVSDKIHSFLIALEFESEDIKPQSTESPIKNYLKYSFKDINCILEHEILENEVEQLDFGCQEILEETESETDEKIIGGTRDEFGCLGTAGYTYNEEVNACIRNWELDDVLKEAAKVAVESTEKEKLTVVEVAQNECEGCFVIKLQDEDYNILEITLKDWLVQDNQSQEL